jgi:hypothetical protein
MPSAVFNIQQLPHATPFSFQPPSPPKQPPLP